MKAFKLSLLSLSFVVPLLSQPATAQPVEAFTGYNGTTFNPEILGSEIQYGELGGYANSYFKSKEGRLLSTNSLLIDQGTTFDQTKVKFPNYVFELHNYIAELEDEIIVDIENAINSRFIVTESGRVFASGFNTHGHLGNGTTTGTSNDRLQETTSFFPDLGTDRVVKISSTNGATVALTTQGQVFAYGNLIPGTINTSSLPINITSLFTDYDATVDPIIDILVGLALTQSGKVYQWANPFNPQIVPSIVFDGSMLEAGEKVIQIIGNPRSMMFLTNEGRIVVKGNNDALQLGINNGFTNILDFTFADLSAFTFLSPTNKINYITFGFLLTEGHQVISWGYNENGVVGTGVNSNAYIPFTDVTATTTQNLSEGEYFVSANRLVANQNSASILVSNLGISYGLGNRNSLGFQLDGINAPLLSPIPINPGRITITVDPLGGPEYGPFYFAKGFTLFFTTALNLSSTNAYVREGFIFGGFFFDEALTQNVLDVFNYKATEDITIYPKWIERQFTIAYISNQALPMTNPNPSNLGGSQLPYTLLAPTLSGYTFVGWYTNAQFTTSITEITADLFPFTTSYIVHARFTVGSSSSETSSLPGSSIPTSSISGDSETPTGPNRIGTILLTTTAVALAGGGFYWFVIAKKSFPALITLFVTTWATIKLFLIGLFKKKKNDKSDKK